MTDQSLLTRYRPLALVPLSSFDVPAVETREQGETSLSRTTRPVVREIPSELLLTVLGLSPATLPSTTFASGLETRRVCHPGAQATGGGRCCES